MQVIPAINEADFVGIAEKVKKAEEFLPEDGWVEIDVAEGIFTETAGFNNPAEFMRLRTRLNVALHLMVQDVDVVLTDWLNALARVTTAKKRVIVHVEVMRDPAFILEECKKRGIEAGLSLAPGTAPDAVLIYAGQFSLIQVLAVKPGPSGQKFRSEMIQRIKFLRDKLPDAILEVDGGINLETAQSVKEAGASIVAATSYIFGSPSPEDAYKELEKI